jgi:hypothetical protein
MVETYVSEAATGERETEDTFTGIAWGAGAAAASCLHPETERPNAAVAARARMNFGLEDLISDNVFLLRKLHRTTGLRWTSVVLRKIGRAEGAQDSQKNWSV